MRETKYIEDLLINKKKEVIGALHILLFVKTTKCVSNGNVEEYFFFFFVLTKLLAYSKNEM
jgi:hypothetical protein